MKHVFGFMLAVALMAVPTAAIADDQLSAGDIPQQEIVTQPVQDASKAKALYAKCRIAYKNVKKNCGYLKVDQAKKDLAKLKKLYAKVKASSEGNSAAAKYVKKAKTLVKNSNAPVRSGRSSRRRQGSPPPSPAPRAGR